MTLEVQREIVDAMEQLAMVFANDRTGGLIGRDLVLCGLDAAIRDLQRARAAVPSRDQIIRASRDEGDVVAVLTRRILRRGDARDAGARELLSP